MKTKRTKQGIKNLLPKIRTALEHIYGHRLMDVILYGSFAKDTPTQDSDIDIAVILEGKLDRVKEIIKIGEVIYNLMLESGEMISVYPISEDEIKNPVWPLYLHIKEEGVRI
ncbi:MAG: nucleotidyltransferase domain-containing protein [Deltaproteobacteria bacterium]|nr:nucleotidyltransferase domain-containing protein [Deltaproteobacteria bacterium]